MCLLVGVGESTNVSLSGSGRVDECVSQWEWESRRMCLSVGLGESTNVSLSGTGRVDE